MLICVSPRLGLSFILTPSRLCPWHGPDPAVLLQQLWKMSAGIPGALPFTLKPLSPLLLCPSHRDRDRWVPVLCAGSSVCTQGCAACKRGFSHLAGNFRLVAAPQQRSWQGGCSFPQGGAARGPSQCRDAAASYPRRSHLGQKVWGSVAVTHKV